MKKVKEKKRSAKLGNTLDAKNSFGNFCCTRPTTEPPSSHHSENMCMNMCFRIYRRYEELIMECTRCGRRYRVSIDDEGMLKYTAEKTSLKKRKRGKSEGLAKKPETIEKMLNEEKSEKKKRKKRNKK